MAKFKVLAERVTLLNALGESVTLEKNEIGDTSDFNANDIIVLSNNGKKGKLKPEDKELSWIYSPSISVEGKLPKANPKAKVAEGEGEETVN